MPAAAMTMCRWLAAFALSACVCDRPPPASPQKPAPFLGDAVPHSEGTPTPGGILRVAMETEPPSLNFQLDPLDAWAKTINALVYDSLAGIDPVSYAHQPRLAERWEVSPDGLQIAFFLRRDVRWHDGAPFTARDVAFTFGKLLDPATKALSVRSYLEPLKSFRAEGNHSVVFTLKRPYFLAFDAIAEVFIYPEHLYRQGDFNTHALNRAPIGTGRFRFAEWLAGDRIELVRHANDFRPPAPLDRILFLLVPDATVRVHMLRRGELDLVLRLTPTAWNELASDADFRARHWLLRHVPTGLQWIGWNVGRPQLADKRVRQALTLLIDRQDIVDNLRYGVDAVATSWFYRDAPERDASLQSWPYDPARAATLLDGAGWRDSNGDGVRDKNGTELAFTLTIPAGKPFYEQLAGLVGEDLRKAGITMDMRKLDWAAFIETLRAGNFEACSLLWELLPRSDPYQIWHSSQVGGGSNYIGYRDAAVDQLLETGRTTFDPLERQKLYRRFAATLHEEQPYTLLFERYNLSAVGKHIGGIQSSPYGVIPLANLYVR